VLPRTLVPLLATITQVLQFANDQPMRVKDIHTACEELLGGPVSYRSLKACLAAKRGKAVDRTSWGLYGLMPEME
jgi:hypothetical protein